jgi:hypothetical protein
MTEDIVEKMPTPILTLAIKEGKHRTEVYLLNPGECFPRFGGSRHGLIVRKTASLIIRSNSGYDMKDTEYDLADPGAWNHLRKLLGNPDKVRLENVPEWETMT